MGSSFGSFSGKNSSIKLKIRSWGQRDWRAASSSQFLRIQVSEDSLGYRKQLFIHFQAPFIFIFLCLFRSSLESGSSYQDFLSKSHSPATEILLSSATSISETYTLNHSSNRTPCRV